MADTPSYRKLISLAAKRQAKAEQCDGTACPGGCCPEQNWFCCVDGVYCASTEADCNKKEVAAKVVKD